MQAVIKLALVCASSVGVRLLTAAAAAMMCVSALPPLPVCLLSHHHRRRCRVSAHTMATMDSSKLDACFRPTEKEYSSLGAYGISKLANVLSARSFNAKYAATGVTAYSVHPGVVATEIGRQGMLTRALFMFLAFTMKTAEDGAATTLYAATSPQALEENAGGYFSCSAAAVGSKLATDDALAEALWVKSEEEIATWKAKQ